LAASVAVTTAIVFGILGAAQAGRITTNDALKTTSINASRGRRARARTLLVGSELALSATLVVGATMLVRSVINLETADLGFEPRGLYSLSLAGAENRSGAERATLTRTLMTRLVAMQGIRSVALTSNPTGGRNYLIGTLEIESQGPPPAN